MRNFKKVVAGLLAVLMLALSVNVSFAEEEYTLAEEIVVAKVNGTGIMTGTDKGFEPSKSLTRAEAAAIIVRMKGIAESAVKATAGTTLFTDVAASHWASGYVNQASNLGIVKGVSATQFAPEREVTIAEFVTMAIRALGAGQLVDSEGAWPTNYVNFANENGILDDVNAIYTSVATRMQAATIVANTLDAVMWTKSGVKSNGEIEWKKTVPAQTILVDTLKYDYMNGLTVKSVKTKDRIVTFEELEEDYEDYSRNVDLSSYKAADAVNLAILKAGDEVDVWFSIADKEIIAVMPAENSKQSKVEFTEIKKAEAGKITLVVDGKEVKYDIHKDGATVVYNEDTTNEIDNDDTLSGFNHKEDTFGRATIVSGDIKGIYMEEYTNFGIVKEIKKDKVYYESDVVGATSNYKFDFDEDNDSDEYVITKDGKEVKALEEGDVIEYYKLANSAKYVINILTESVDGKVNSIGSDYLKLDGTKYTFAKTFAVDDEFAVKDEVTLYLNSKKEVVMATVDEEAMDSTIGIITYARVKTDDYGTLTYELKVTNLDNTESDVLTLDQVKTYDKLSKDGYEFFTDNTKTASDEKKDQIKAKFGTTSSAVEDMLGVAVRYAVNGNKLTIAEIAWDGDVYTSYEEAKITLVDDTIDSDKDKIGTYRVTDSTVILTMVDGDEDYEKEFEEVEFADLANDGDFTGYAFDIDEDTNKVKYFVSLEDLSRDDSNYAIVKGWATSDVDDEDLITLFTVDGVVEIAIDSEELVDNAKVKGALVKYNSGDKITDLTVVKTKTQVGELTANKVIAFNEDSIKYYVPATQTDPATYTFIDCEEELLILTYDDTYADGLKIAKGLPDVDTLEHITAGNDECDSVIFLIKEVDDEDVVFGLIYAE